MGISRHKNALQIFQSEVWRNRNADNISTQGVRIETVKTWFTCVGLLLVAAVLVRVYGPARMGITFLSAGVERGVGFNIVAFWLLLILAIGVVATYILRRNKIR
jgi:hypothetical protein